MVQIELASSSLEKSISTVNDFCSKYFNNDKEFCFKVKLVYEELITNMFKYAVKCGTTFVDIDIKKIKDNVYMLFSYDGDKFDPTAYKDKRIDEPFSRNKENGGLGLFLVAKFSKSFDYERINGVNKLNVTI